jgi:mannose-6-phosphate isomerase-like protein (cupin superfamily)
MQKYHRANQPDTIAPDTIEIRYLVDEPQGATRLSMCEGTLQAGKHSEKVYHTVYEEIWYFLQGAGIFHLHAPDKLEESSFPVGPGDAVLVSPRHGFWVENIGSDPLVFLLAGSPPWGNGQEAHRWSEFQSERP